jgi:hypothetical protein
MIQTISPMEAARRQWWDGLSKQGDPMRIVNPLSAGFRAGWEASGSINAELLEALKTLERMVVELYPGHVEPDGEHIGEYQAVWSAVHDARAAIAKASGGAE